MSHTKITLPEQLERDMDAIRGEKSRNAFIQEAIRLLIRVRTTSPQPPKFHPIANEHRR